MERIATTKSANANTKKLNGRVPPHIEHGENVHGAYAGLFGEIDQIVAVFENLSWKRALVATVAFVGALAMGSYGVVQTVGMLMAGAVVLSTPAWIALCLAVLVAWIGTKMVVGFAARIGAKIIAGAYDEPVQGIADRVRNFGNALKPRKNVTQH